MQNSIILTAHLISTLIHLLDIEHWSDKLHVIHILQIKEPWPEFQGFKYQERSSFQEYKMFMGNHLFNQLIN